MRKITIIYNPNLSVEEIARLNNCSINTVRQYIRQHQIDRQGDNMLIQICRIKELRRRGMTYVEITEKLPLSYATVAKYAKMVDNEVDWRTLQNEEKRSTIQDGRNRSMIKSYSESQQEILEAILNLHVRKRTFDCDLTYGDGSFYKGINKPLYRFDIAPRFADVRPIEHAALLLEGSIGSIIVDLPFIIQAGEYTGNKSVVKKRYCTFASEEELKKTYYELIQLAHRLLSDNGILVVKTQDTSFNGKQIWVHSIVESYADEIGFVMIDLFIKTNDHVMLRPTYQVQKVARKYHSYFYVFKLKS